MLYLIGLGLGSETDITVKGLEIVKGADRVYLEAYTSILGVDKTRLVSLLCSFVETCVLTKSDRSFRKNFMAEPSFSQTVRWSSRTAMKSYETQIVKM